MSTNNIVILSGTASAVAIAFTIYSLVGTILSKRKQKKLLEGLEYRRIHGRFDISQYVGQGRAIKNLSWKKQRNTGPDPKAFQKKLPRIDYFQENMKLTGNKKAVV